MRKLIVIISVLLIAKIFSGQEITDPTAARGKYASSPDASAVLSQIPVNLSTGIPSINIPITSIAGYTMEMPVSMSYNASGIKVSEYASWVGLGWSLNAGGVITRQVMGRPDEEVLSGYGDVSNGNWGDGLWGTPNGGYLNNNHLIPNSFNENDASHQNLARRTVHGLLDTQPDEFYFNFMGRSGMFVFDENDWAVMIPYQDIKIQVIGSLFDGFILTDENGYKYWFEVKEKVSSNNSCGSQGQGSTTEFVSSWYLTKVVNANEQIEIELEYEQNPNNSHTYSWYEIAVDYWGSNCPAGVWKSCQTTNTHKIQHISKIKGINGYVKFIKGLSREDLTGDKKLDAIELYTNSNEFLGKYSFDQNYFNGLGDTKRLKLDQITQYNSNNESFPPTIFEYNTTPLPAYNSTSVDHWGFYNGSSNNTHLLLPFGSYYNCWGKEPHKDKVKAGILESITYPSGYIQTLEYEPQEYGTSESSLISHSSSLPLIHHNHQNTSGSNDISQFTVFDSQPYLIEYDLRAPCANKTTSFEIRDSQNNILFSFSTTGTGANTGNTTLNLTSGEYQVTSTRPSGCSSAYALVSVYTHHYFGGNSKSKYGGGLRIKSISSKESSSAIATTTSYFYNSFNETDRSSGVLLTQPVYSNSVNSGLEIWGDTGWPKNCDGISDDEYKNECKVDRKYSFSIRSLIASQGGYVLYTNVTEVKNCTSPVNCENGRTEYEFENYPVGATDNIIQEPADNRHWRRGNMVAARIYNSTNQLLSSTVNSYELLTQDPISVRGLKANDRLIRYYSQQGSPSPGCYIRYTMKGVVYSYKSEKYGLKTSTVRIYDQYIPSKYNTTTTTYEYGGGMQPVVITAENVESGETTKKKIRYPGHYYPFCTTCNDEQSQAINAMAYHNRHITALPIEILSLKKINGQFYVIGGTISEFELDNSSKILAKGSHYLALDTPILESNFPNSVISSGNFTQSQSYLRANRMDTYDSNLRVISSKKENDILSTVIRDYSDGRVVAEITNAAANQCAYTSFETSTTGGWTYNNSYTTTSNITVLEHSLPKAKTGSRVFAGGTSRTISRSTAVGKYIVSFWANANVTVKVGSTTQTASVSAEGTDLMSWRYYEYVLTLSSAATIQLTVGSNVFVDELRLYPADAQMKTTAYNTDGTVRTTCGINNRCVTYLYDGWKRLTWTLDDNFQILTQSEYRNKGYYPGFPAYRIDRVVTAQGITKTQVEGSSGTNDNVTTAVEYFDGFGRALQKISIGTSPDFGNMVSFHQYDALGREPRSYLPYTMSGSAGFIGNPLSQQQSFYQSAFRVAHTNYAYSETEYEASPLSRVLRQGNVGEQWQLNTTHTVAQKTLLNDANEVLLWKKESNNLKAMTGSNARYYPANTLIKNEVTDEHGNKMWQYTDAHGKLICKRAQNWMRGSGAASYSDYYGTGKVLDPYVSYLPGTEPTLRDLYTYYIYDDFGRLAYELPVAVTVECNNNYTVSTTSGGTNYYLFDGYITASEYDKRGRQVRKKKPGEDWTEYVYNNLNQPVLSKIPGSFGGWSFWHYVKYDALGRAVQTGLHTGTTVRSTLQDQQDALTSNLWETKTAVASTPYTNVSFPNTSTVIYTETYYDDYVFNDVAGFVYGAPTVSQSKRTRGAVTGTKTMLTDGSTVYLKAVTFYDANGRAAVQYDQNKEGGHDKLNSEYDYTGKLVKTTRSHKYTSSSTPLTIQYRYEYDRAGRATTTRMKIGGADELIISKLIYNPLGQVVQKHLHITEQSNTGMQIIDYRYNERGWLTKINNADLVDDGDNLQSWDVFGEELVYYENNRFTSAVPGSNPVIPSTNTSMEMRPQYNGNVAAIKWKTKGHPDNAGDQMAGHSYVFRYDMLGQMTGAYYARSTDTDIDNYKTKQNHWDERVSYLSNGNIKSLSRTRGKDDSGNTLTNAVTMDNLAYTYTAGSNKVQKINDSATLTTWANKYSHFVDGSNATTEYTYDASGRMTTDLNKGVTYSYTAQGLVQTATMGSNTITFIWDAAGRKLAKKINTTTIINYMGGIEYTNDVLTHIATPEGIARLSDSTWVYDYYLKDHLGNVRAVITSEGAEIKEEKATMELYRRELENLSFDNIEETGTNTPPGYPYDPYDPDNRLVSSLSSSLGEVIGPAKLMTVKNGTKLDLDAQYWYTEYPGDPLDDITQILAGVLINLGNISTGVFTPGSEEGMDLLNNVTTPQFAALYDFIEGSFDNVNLSNPQAYLVYVYFDMDDMMLMKQYSGIIQVGDPDELAKLEHIDMKPHKDGFLYTYVTNRSVGKVNFDNLRVRYWKPKVRVQYDYYPYGLPWENPAVPSQGQEGLHDYLYQDKEFQFSEFSDGSGLALYDFHARMYDPATATWSVPDPAGQFSNPYLAMGNNPVSMVDPTGEVALWDDAIVAGAGFAIGYVGYGIKNGDWGGKAFAAGGIGAGVALLSYYTAGGFGLAAGGTVSGGASFAAGYAVSSAVNSSMPSIPIFQSENFNLSISPMIGIGSSGLNFGVSLNASGQIGDWSYAGGVGVGYNSGVSSLGDAVGGSRYWNAGGFLGYTHNNTLYGGGYSYNRFFGGKTNQGVGAAHLQIGGFSMRFDEDYFGDGEDRYRTGGLLMTYKVNNDLTLAFGGSMMTGWHQGEVLKGGNPNAEDGRGLYDNCNEDLYNLRGGTMYGGVIYKGQSYFYGHNSEKRLHAIQNAIHRNWPIRTSPYFEDRMFGSRFYSYYGSYHPFYLFY